MKNKKIKVSVLLSASLVMNYLPVIAEENSGWINNDGTWSYVKEDGSIAKGWIKDNDCWYAFDDNGAMRTGWIASNEHWYFMGESGVMQADAWVEDNGARYYIKGTGVMAKDYVKDGYELTEDGKAIPLAESKSVVLTDPEALEGEVIEGNLYVDVTTAKALELKGVTVKGKLVVIGDNKTAGKLTITDSKIEAISTQTRNTEVVLSGETEVKTIVLEETAAVTPDKNFKGEVEKIEVQSTTKGEIVIEVPAQEVSTRTYASVDIQAPVESLEVKTDTQIKVNADVKNVVVTESAKDTAIEVSKGSTVGTLTAKAPMKIKGNGTINKVEANVNGVEASKDTVIEDVETNKGVTEAPEINKPSTGGSVGGSGGGGGSTPITYDLSIKEGNQTLAVADTVQLHAIVKPSTANQKVTWQTSNDSVATIDENGLVTAHGLGDCTITASDTYGNKAEINIIVDTVKLTELDSYIDNNTVVVGAELNIYYECKPENATHSQLEWSSDNPDIADFNTADKLVAKKPGTAVITGKAKDGSGLSVVYTLNVISPESTIDVSSIFTDEHFSAINNTGNPFTINHVLGSDWLKSSNEGINKSSSSIKFNVQGKGYLLFDYLLSCEYQSNYLSDYMIVKINDTIVNVKEPLMIDGQPITSFKDIRPETRQFKLTKDINEVVITYTKNNFTSQGLDALWLSNFRFVDENNPEQRNLKINYDSGKGNVMLSTTAQSDPVLVNDGQDVVMNLSDSIKLEAIPMENRVFMGWYENNELFSQINSISFDLLADRNLEARFYDYAKLPNTLIVQRTGSVTENYNAVENDLIIQQNPISEKNNVYQILIGMLEEGTSISADVNGKKVDIQDNCLTITQPKDTTIITLTVQRDKHVDVKRSITINVDVNLNAVVAEGRVEVQSVNGRQMNGYSWKLSNEIFNETGEVALIPNEIGESATYENLQLITTGPGVLQFDYKTDFSDENSYLMMSNALINISNRDMELPASNDWTTYILPIDVNENATKNTYLAYFHRMGEMGAPAVKNVNFIQDNAVMQFGSSDEKLGSVSAKYPNGTVINNNTSVPLGKNVTFNAAASSDAEFIGWYNKADELLSFSETYTTTIINDLDIYALFTPKGTYTARIGNQVFTSLQEAFASDLPGNVILIGNVTLTDNLIIPENKTLVIPCFSGDEGYDARDENQYNPDGTTADSKDHKILYQTLTVPKTTILEVQGTLIVNAVTGRTQAGHFDMDNTGGYGQLNLDGTMVISGNGVVEATGFVKGSGSLTVKDNGILRDLYVVKNWRGGTQALIVYLANVYPMNEADCKNVEVPITILDHGVYAGVVKMYASSSYNKTRFPLIDQKNGLIRMNENAEIKIVRNDDNSRTSFLLKGGARAAGTRLNVVGFDLSTSTFIYPIDGDTTYELSDGIYIFENDFKFLTGSELYVKNGAELILNEGNTLVFYDKFDDVINTSTTKYPDRPASFINMERGTAFVINGSFAGNIVIDENADRENAITINTGANAKFTVITKEANGYKNGVRDLTFNATINGKSFDFEPNTTYTFYYEDSVLKVLVNGIEPTLFNETDADIIEPENEIIQPTDSLPEEIQQTTVVEDSIEE